MTHSGSRTLQGTELLGQFASHAHIPWDPGLCYRKAATHIPLFNSSVPSRVEVKEIIGDLYGGLMGGAEGYCCQVQHHSHPTIKQNTKEKGPHGFSHCLLKEVYPWSCL